MGVGSGLTGESIDGWIYSEPVHLGTAVVSGSTTKLTIPTTTALGAHRIAIVDAEGILVGWADIQLTGASVAGREHGAGLGAVTGSHVVAELGSELRRASLGSRHPRSS